MRTFRDIEAQKIVTEAELAKNYARDVTDDPETYKDITFGQYINNCLTSSNGTLEEIPPKTRMKRMHECIFDITTVVYGRCGLRWQDWWPQDSDSRDVFESVCECAKFYEDFFPDDDSEDYLFDIEMLARAWFKDEYGESLTQEEKTYLFKDQRISAYIRLHLDEGWDEYDYDSWCNVEYVVGEPINDKEYHALNEIFASLAELDARDRAEVKAKLENIRNPMKEYVVRIVQHKNVDFSVVVKAHCKEEAAMIFRQKNDDDEYAEEWADANDFADIEDESASIEEVKG